MRDVVGWMRVHIHGILMDLHGWPSRNTWETFKQLYHCWQAGFLGASFSGVFWFLQDMRHAASGEGWVASVRSLEPTSIFWSFPSVAAYE